MRAWPTAKDVTGGEATRTLREQSKPAREARPWQEHRRGEESTNRSPTGSKDCPGTETRQALATRARPRSPKEGPSPSSASTDGARKRGREGRNAPRPPKSRWER